MIPKKMRTELLQLAFVRQSCRTDKNCQCGVDVHKIHVGTIMETDFRMSSTFEVTGYLQSGESVEEVRLQRQVLNQWREI